MTASSKALRKCLKTADSLLLSNKHLHEITGRAPPPLLRKINSTATQQNLQWQNNNQGLGIKLNNNIIKTSRQTTFATRKTNRLKVGMNILSNRLWHLNGRIKLGWLNSSFEIFKIKCKLYFLSWLIRKWTTLDDRKWWFLNMKQNLTML